MECETKRERRLGAAATGRLGMPCARQADEDPLIRGGADLSSRCAQEAECAGSDGGCRSKVAAYRSSGSGGESMTTRAKVEGARIWVS